MRNTFKELTREELEDVLLQCTYIEPNDMETMGWVKRPKNMYTVMSGIQKENKIKL